MLAGSRPERLEPFSCVLKGAGRGRKNKPRHTLGGCRLARALGTSSPVPGYGAQPALPPGTHPRLGRFRSVLKLFLGAIRNNFFIEYGISQYFSREMGYLDQKGDFLSGSMCDAYVLMHLYPSKGLQHHLPNYCMWDAPSETQGPKDKKVWKVPDLQNQTKFSIVENLQYAINNTILHEFSKRRSVWKKPGLVLNEDGMPCTTGCICKSLPSWSHWVRLVTCI